jgi:cytochrome c5
MSLKQLFKVATAVGVVSLIVAAPASAADGAAVYDKACKMCHGAGMMGAPKTGDKAAWAPRIAQGDATLNEHAIKGFKGMPAKGGKSALSDDEVKAAVAHMVGASK